MTTRRSFLIGLAALGPIPLRAQPAKPPGKRLRVGILRLGAEDYSRVTDKVFIDALRELGWVEGRNIVYDRVDAAGVPSRLPALARDLVARGPDLIHATANPAALAMHAATRTVPIVFAFVSDPVEEGLIKSFPQPGGNVTGVSTLNWELSGKRMQLLKEAMPALRRVGVLITTSVYSSKGLKLVEDAAGSSVEVVPTLARNVSELETAFALLEKARVEAVIISGVTLFLRERKRILQLAAGQRLPVAGQRGEVADDGALFAYGSLRSAEMHRSAHLADKVLRGTRPSDIPVEQPTQFELVVNLKTARLLGITLPQSILLQATRVID